MRWIIRQTNSLVSTDTELQDKVFETNQLSIGTSLDSDLVLSGADIKPEHAVCTLDRKGHVLVKKANSQATLMLAGQKKGKVSLEGENELEMGRYRLKQVTPPAGFDVALSLTVAATLEDKPEQVFQRGASSLKEAGWKMRPWAWMLFLVCLAVGLGLPAAKLLLIDDDGRADTLNWADQLWNPGPLSKVHHIPGLGDNCQSCHSVLFEPVKDEDCVACHSVGVHITSASAETIATQNGLERSHELISEGRCAACHIEHKFPEILIREDETLCTDCHENLGGDAHKALIEQVSGFDDHPEFKLSMLVQLEETNEWLYQRYLTTDKSLEESSNLVFSHQLHMNPNGIDGPQGREILECQSCHETGLDGKGLKSISMETHCASCHSLAFEPTDTNTQAPHADLETIKVALEAYYARQYALNNGPTRSSVNLERDAVRPGKPPRNFYANVKEWALDKSDEVLIKLVEQTACSTCHLIEDNTSDAGKVDANIPWHIKPVEITARWYHKAEFDHSAHEVFECDSCHLASESDMASDILIPALDNCQQCHAGSHGQGLQLDESPKTVTPCLGCHQYHLSPLDLAHEKPELDVSTNE